MDSQPKVDLSLDPKVKKEKSRTVKLLVSYNRRAVPYSLGAKNKYIANSLAEIKLTKKYREELSSINEKFAIAVQIVKELDANFTFEIFSYEYRKRAFNKGVKVEKAKTADLKKLFDEYEKNSEVSDKTMTQYRISLNWLLRYKKDVSIHDIDKDFLKKFTDFIKTESKKDFIDVYYRKYKTKPTYAKQIEDTSISSYLRGLRAVCYFAVEEEYVSGWKSPFGRGKRAVKLTTKVRSQKALKDDNLQKFASYVPTGENINIKEFGWCMFMLCFQCGGMNPTDIYDIINRDIEGNELRYVRQKTTRTNDRIKEVDILIPDLSMQIIHKHGKIDPSNPHGHIFPFFRYEMTEKQKRNITDSMNKKVNNGLTQICKDLGIPRCTLSQARHSQATYLADMLGDDKFIESIAQRMAHNDTEITKKHYIELTKNKKLRIKALFDELVASNTYFNSENYFSS